MTETRAPGMEHLSDAEALMWALEDDPVLRSGFMGVTFVDGPPDVARFRRKMERALHDIDVLRQRVVPMPFDLAPPKWEQDPDFALDHHVRLVSLPPPGDRRQLLDLAAEIYERPFDRSRPLWEFTLVEGLADGRCALLSKMHHVVSDGVGAVRVSASFLDLAADGDDLGADGAPDPNLSDGDGRAPQPSGTDPAAPPPAAGPLAWLQAAIGALGPIVSTNAAQARRGAGAVAGGLSSAVRSPTEGLSAGVSTARSLGRQLGLTDPARSPLWTGRSGEHRFDTWSFDLERVQAVARRREATVNDVFVTIMAGAAGGYHEALGAPVDELRISMPISVRHDRAVGGNAWVPARVLVPTGPMRPADRLAEVSARLAAVKHEPSLGFADAVAGVARHLPRPVLVRLARQQVATVDFACSNVRGAPFDLWVAGAHVEANHPMGPTAGVAFNATVLSYRGRLDLGLNSDRAAVTDPDRLLACLRSAAEEILALD